MLSAELVKCPSAEIRFRQAFERLKSGQPTLLAKGTLVTQNNVAREAGCDPTALRKARFPALIREIQAYLELHKPDEHLTLQKAARRKAAKRSSKERLDDAIRQRDKAQSTLTSANYRIVELSNEVQALQRQLDELRPPPKKFGGP